jgi:hypothetical protein
MLYAEEAMEELRNVNGPLANTHIAEPEVVGEEGLEQPPRGYLAQRDYDEAAGELPEELPKGIVLRLEDLQRRLGRCEGRLELSQVSESLLREQLKRERERADRLEAELREAQAELRVAEVERHKSRRGWFRHFFGMRAAKH